MRTHVTALDAGTDHARGRRTVVDLWYFPCVLAPLLICISSPAWYPALFNTQRPGIQVAAGFLAAGWVPWLIALVSALALADRYEITRHPRGTTEADAWDKFSIRLLAITGGAGALLSVMLAGLVLSVATS